MKSCIAFVAIALIAVFVVPSQSVKVCEISCNLRSTTNVCAKYGTICRRFSNACNHKIYNCANSKTYATVALSRCRSISVGGSGTCLAATSTSTSSSLLSSLNSLSSLSGLYGSSNVYPIVISG